MQAVTTAKTIQKIIQAMSENHICRTSLKVQVAGIRKLVQLVKSGDVPSTDVKESAKIAAAADQAFKDHKDAWNKENMPELLDTLKQIATEREQQEYATQRAEATLGIIEAKEVAKEAASGVCAAMKHWSYVSTVIQQSIIDKTLSHLAPNLVSANRLTELNQLIDAVKALHLQYPRSGA